MIISSKSAETTLLWYEFFPLQTSAEDTGIKSSFECKKPAVVRLFITRHVNNRSSPDQETFCCYQNTPLLFQQQILWYLPSLDNVFQIFCCCPLCLRFSTHLHKSATWSFPEPLHTAKPSFLLSTKSFLILTSWLKLGFLNLRFSWSVILKLCKCAYFFRSVIFATPSSRLTFDLIAVAM